MGVTGGGWADGEWRLVMAALLGSDMHTLTNASLPLV